MILKNEKIEKDLKRSRGFALLFAILASSLLLSVSLSILNIALREVVFSSFGRESQIALYAADTGLECALYFDVKYSAFSTSTPTTIDCGTGSLAINGLGTDISPRVNNDILVEGSMSGPCVSIRVSKQYFGSTLVTDVSAYGHNTCDLSSPLRVERGLFTSY